MNSLAKMELSKEWSMATILQTCKVPDVIIDLLTNAKVKVVVGPAKMSFLKGPIVLAKVEGITLDTLKAWQNTAYQVQPQQVVEVYVALVAVFKKLDLPVPPELTDMSSTVTKPNLFSTAAAKEAVKTDEQDSIMYMFSSENGKSSVDFESAPFPKKGGWGGVDLAAEKPKVIETIPTPKPKEPFTADYASLEKKVGAFVAAKKPAKIVDAIDSKYDFSPVEKQFMHSANKIPLVEATKLYHPVNGSDKESCYFLIAASEELRVGARLRHGKLSIRVEGQPKNLVALNDLFGGVKPGAYWSIHFSVTSNMIATKTVGAVLAVLSTVTKFKTEMPSMLLLEGMGA